MKHAEGTIYRSISGFYKVKVGERSFTCKPKGLFRHTQEKPLVGDRVMIEYDPEDDVSESRLIEILPRKNQLIRPSVVNVDHAIIVMSLVEPDFSYGLLDYYLVSTESMSIHSSIVLTKYDLLEKQLGCQKAIQTVMEIKEIYQPIGYNVFQTGLQSEQDSEIGSIIQEGIYVVMGQSGVGKSTLLNRLLPEAAIETNEISDALNRGKHTTREVTLYPYGAGLVADTPGFSSIDLPTIEKEELRLLFPEIAKHGQDCHFRSCLHLKEPKCQVKQAVESGLIARSRYQSYQQIFQRMVERKPQYH